MTRSFLPFKKKTNQQLYMDFPCGKKDPALSLKRLRLKLWLGFNPWLWGPLHAHGYGQKRKKKKEKFNVEYS